MNDSEKTSDKIKLLAIDICNGNRRALSRAITLIESTNINHRSDADELLSLLMPKTGKSIRIGISGVPGVGKSTFIEKFGNHIIDQGHKLAVLAVDPSSQISGGSILGDKTRMESLAHNDDVFIRPSPAGKTLGGVARRTREAILICEAAGFDVILIETVGVGQSETAVYDMSDIFMLLLLPGGGDELQGIKKGIVEMADIILVNKADGSMKDIAEISAQDYRNALHLLRPSSQNWQVPVKSCSALTGQAIDEIWQLILNFKKISNDNGEILQRRAKQNKAWLWTEITELINVKLRQDPRTTSKLAQMENSINDGSTKYGQSPATAARSLMDIFFKS